jgi:glycosyltransferase involved in cell wall biosynthesis
MKENRPLNRDKLDVVLTTSSYLDTGHGGVEAHIMELSTAMKDVPGVSSVRIVRTAPRNVTNASALAASEVPYVVLPSVQGGARQLGSRANLPATVSQVLELLRRLARGLTSGGLADEFLNAVGVVDVVHQHDFLESWGLTRRLARRGYRVVWTNHLGEFLYLMRVPFGPALLRWLTKHYSAVIAPSNELADARGIFTPCPRMVSNGVDTNQFRAAASMEEVSDLRARLGLPKGSRVAIVPRRWAPTKGVIFVAEAMCMQDWPEDLFVVFAGSGVEEYPGYSRGIKSLLAKSTAPHLIFPRVSRNEMAEMLRASDLCLIPSIKEATSLSALEAMASGCTVVAAATGGMPQIITERRTGYLHATGDARSLLEAIRRALDDGIDPRVTLHAREVVKSNYRWERVARICVDLYRGE